MSGSELKRRLAGILCADAVGYSRLMSLDERTTLAALDTARDVFREHIEANQGRVIDMAGDSVLAVFETAIGAVAAALSAQERINASADKEPEERRMRFRVGAHIGDVIQKADGSVYGDGINIAARLQGLAEPGGVSISDALRSAVRGKLPTTFEDLGEQRIKNIAEPIRVFQVRSQHGEAPSRVRPGVAIDASSKGEGTAIAHALVDMHKPVPGFGGRAAIAVLPFNNLSGDPDQEFFADGLAEDILTRIASGRWFPVIARNSSFSYKGRAINAKEVGNALGARYLVEGSVRKVGNRVRVVAQLIDAASGLQIWAEKYDRVLEDLFAIQDELTEGISGALGGVVERAEVERSRSTQPSNLDAWETFWRGMWHQQQFSKEGFSAALPLLMRAAELDPTMSHPHAAIAWQKMLSAIFLWTDTPQQTLAEAVASARSALAADPAESFAHSILGNVLAFAGKYDESLALCLRGVELNPSNANGYGSLAASRLFRGEFAQSMEAAKAEIRLSPNDIWLQAPLGILAAAHYQLMDYENAVAVARLTIQRKSSFPTGWRTLAAALGHTGQLAEARDALSQFLFLMPGYVNEQVARSHSPYRDEAHLQHSLEGLRKAGWTG